MNDETSADYRVYSADWTLFARRVAAISLVLALVFLATLVGPVVQNTILALFPAFLLIYPIRSVTYRTPLNYNVEIFKAAASRPLAERPHVGILTGPPNALDAPKPTSSSGKMRAFWPASPAVHPRCHSNLHHHSPGYRPIKILRSVFWGQPFLNSFTFCPLTFHRMALVLLR